MLMWFVRTGRLPRGSIAALNRMVAELAKEHGVTVEQLRSSNRRKPIVAIRQDIMARAYATGRWSYISVGKALDRDHTTVIHACRKVRALAEQEALL